MNVNFNNLRKKSCIVYDNLVEKLNDAIKKYETEYSEKGILLINCNDIQSEMDELRILIGSIAMTYSENNTDIKDVFGELYPDDNTMAQFNPDSD